ncbi:hypothetical protein D9M69_542540 [compost metagenome]
MVLGTPLRGPFVTTFGDCRTKLVTWQTEKGQPATNSRCNHYESGHSMTTYWIDNRPVEPGGTVFAYGDRTSGGSGGLFIKPVNPSNGYVGGSDEQQQNESDLGKRCSHHVDHAGMGRSTGRCKSTWHDGLWCSRRVRAIWLYRRG